MAQYGNATIAVPFGVATQASFGLPILTFFPIQGYAVQVTFGSASIVSPQGGQAPAAIGTSDLAIAITGVASAAAVGTPKVNSTLIPTGIARSSTFGRIVMPITHGISAAVALGSPNVYRITKVTFGSEPIAIPQGYSSQATFGSESAVIPGGYSLQITFGNEPAVIPAGYSAQAAFGIPSVDLTNVVTVDATGFAAQTTLGVTLGVVPQGYSAQASVGSATVTLETASITVDATGFAAQAAFGDELAVPVSGISSSVGVGTLGISITLSVTGVSAQAAFGTPVLSSKVPVVGVALAAAFGTPILSFEMYPVGTEAPVAFGIPVISGGELSLTPDGFADPVAFGSLEVLVPSAPTVEAAPQGAGLGIAKVHPISEFAEWWKEAVARLEEIEQEAEQSAVQAEVWLAEDPQPIREEYLRKEQVSREDETIAASLAKMQSEADGITEDSMDLAAARVRLAEVRNIARRNREVLDALERRYQARLRADDEEAILALS